MIIGIDHIAIAVRSLADGRIPFEKLGLRFEATEEVPIQKVRVAICRIGGVNLELLEPTDPDSPIQGFLEKRGTGIHHLAFRTTDVDNEMQLADRRGLQLLQREATFGAHGARICFLHPNSTGRILVELCELPATAVDGIADLI